jgi:hypothetical protein
VSYAQLKERLAALAKEKANGDETKMAFAAVLIHSFTPIIESARHEAAAEMQELCSQHFPKLEWDTDGDLCHAECACGFKLLFHGERSFDLIEDWQNHIRSLGPPEVQAAMEAHDAKFLVKIAELEKWIHGFKGRMMDFQDRAIKAEQREQQAAANALAHLLWATTTKHDVRTCACVQCENARNATSADIAAKAKEHDAKIRRDASEALAWLATELEKRRSVMEGNDNAWWEKYEHCRELAGLPQLTAQCFPTKQTGGGKSEQIRREV